MRSIVATTLQTISTDFKTIEDSNVIIRATNIFYQTFVTENSKLNSSGLAIEIPEETLSNIFIFVDKVFSNLDIVQISTQESVKIKLQKGIEYILRGSMANFAPGDSPLNKQGVSIAVSASKINVQGIEINKTVNFTNSEGKS